MKFKIEHHTSDEKEYEEIMAVIDKYSEIKPNKPNIFDSLLALRIGRQVLNGFKEKIGIEEYSKIINSPIKSCSCGFIKEGDETICPKCEVKNG